MMNEILYRSPFNQMKTPEKLMLMKELAARYDMTFLGLHTFARWGQNCTTGVFGNSSLFPAIQSRWAGNGSPWG